MRANTEARLGLYRLIILSLGAGVQSSCLLLMACRGELQARGFNKLDLAIFADTGWESLVTYQWLEFLKREAAKAGIVVITVDGGDLRGKMLFSVYRGTYDKNERWASMPCFVNNDGKIGMMRRQCTKEHKIEPIKQATRKALGLRFRQRAPKDCVEQWIGISTDEYSRIWNYRPDHMSSVRFPLVEMGMSRWDCARWLHDNYGRVPPKSACIGCPYHSNNEWRALSPTEFKDACEFDRAIRNKVGLRGQTFLHRSCIPLEHVDLRTPEDRGQMMFNFVKDEKLNLFVRGTDILNG